MLRDNPAARILANLLTWPDLKWSTIVKTAGDSSNIDLLDQIEQGAAAEESFSRSAAHLKAPGLLNYDFMSGDSADTFMILHYDRHIAVAHIRFAINDSDIDTGEIFALRPMASTAEAQAWLNQKIQEKVEDKGAELRALQRRRLTATCDPDVEAFRQLIMRAPGAQALEASQLQDIQEAMSRGLSPQKDNTHLDGCVQMCEMSIFREIVQKMVAERAPHEAFTEMLKLINMAKSDHLERARILLDAGADAQGCHSAHDDVEALLRASEYRGLIPETGLPLSQECGLSQG